MGKALFLLLKQRKKLMLRNGIQGKSLRIIIQIWLENASDSFQIGHIKDFCKIHNIKSEVSQRIKSKIEKKVMVFCVAD